MSHEKTLALSRLRLWMALLFLALLAMFGLWHVAEGSENLALGVVSVIAIPCGALFALFALLMTGVHLTRLGLGNAIRRKQP
ncbi:MAG TPA: hypothetical protein VGR19_06340 [Allosphingosinicella sp.]|nr:hypothetical protein [Allosphingosinicella sp.]